MDKQGCRKEKLPRFEEESVTVLSDFDDEISVIVLSDSSDVEDENSIARADFRSRRPVTPQIALTTNRNGWSNCCP